MGCRRFPFDGKIFADVTFSLASAYTDDRSVMRNVLSWSGDRLGLSLSGSRNAVGRAALAVPAGLAACAGADRSRVVPASVLTGGGRYDEGCCLEESEISAGHPVQTVSYYVSVNTDGPSWKESGMAESRSALFLQKRR